MMRLALTMLRRDWRSSELRVLLLALVVSVAVGVLFGFFPARRASQQDPIAAIRQ